MVLGLELDQKVMRNSSEHFKTQPHFDDPRVQWWLGDVAKSLTLLPRSYFERSYDNNNEHEYDGAL